MVDKVTLANVSSFVNDTSAVNTVNNNMAAITTAMDNTLSRDGTSPNTMGAVLDMNSNQIINLPSPGTMNSPARLVDVVTNPTVVIPATGTSGHVVPFLDGNNTWSGTNIIPGFPTLSANNTWTGTDIFNADVYFKSGRPWADVRAYGAVGDGSTNDSTAFSNAIAALASTGGIVWVPPGNYVVNSGISITSSTVSIWLLGAGLGSVEIQCGNSDVTLLTLNNNRHRVSNITFAGSTTLNGTHPCIVVGANATETLIDHCLAINGKYVVQVTGGDINMIDCNFSQAYGSSIIYCTGQFWGRRLKCDQQFPVSVPTGPITYAAWAASTAYTVGTIVSTGNYLIQAKTVTGDNKSSTVAPTLLPYGTDIVDNHVTWRLVAPIVYSSINIDTGSSVATFNQVDMSGPFQNGLLISNSLAGQAPQNVSVVDSFFGFCHDNGILMNAGAGLMVRNCQFASILGANAPALQTTGAAGGDILFANNLVIGTPYGVILNTGINISIVGNNIFGCSGAAVFIQTGVTRVTCVGNNVGSSSTWGTNALAFQLNGTCDYITVSDNTTQGASTELNNASTGSHNYVKINKDVVGTITNDSAPVSAVGERQDGITPGTQATVSFTNTSPNLSWTAHGLAVGCIIFFTTAPATNFSTNTNYYIKQVIDANTFTVSATPGGTAITAGSTTTATGVANSFQGTSATATDIAWITLTAGDWEVSGSAVGTCSGNATAFAYYIHTVSNTFPAVGSRYRASQLPITVTAGTVGIALPPQRISVANGATQNVFVGAINTFSTGNSQVAGQIHAIRVR